jgi:hypothetical protein
VPAYFAARGFLCQAGRLGMDVDVGKFRKMIHDYVKDHQLELFDVALFPCFQSFVTF